MKEQLRFLVKCPVCGKTMNFDDKDYSFKGKFDNYIKLVDEQFNGYEIITRSTTIDNIKQRDNFKLSIGQFVKAEVCKKGGTRLFLSDEKIIALDDCI